jgi:lantibiotic leader peptide-processing serine protease
MHRKASLWISLAAVAVLGVVAGTRNEPLAPVVHAESAGQPATGSSGMFIVLFRSPNAVPGNAERLVASAGGTLIRTLPQIGVAIARSSDFRFADRLARAPEVAGVAEDPLIRWIPPDIPRTVLQESLPLSPAAHDPAAAAFFPLQWNMRAIQADQAWAAGHQGHPAVTVAILDSGIDPTHIDLIGTVDAARSVSFVTDLPDLPECSDPSLIATHFPGAPPWIDLDFHGTHVAGIVAAQGFGVSGVAPHVRLMAVKVLNVCAFGTFGWVIQGIVHAADAGADILNLSLAAAIPRSCRFEGLEPGDRGDLRNECAALLSAMNRATNYAHRQGALVVAAAGNAALNLDRSRDLVVLPAQNPNVATVSATGPVDAIGVEPDTVASYTNFGNSLVDVAAPGGDFRRFPDGDWFLDMVLSPCSRFSLTIPDCQTGHFFVFAAGTSMAAPHAAGVAALIDSRFQGALNGSQLRTRLQQTSDDLGNPGNDPFYGHGRVNAFAAVQ